MAGDPTVVAPHAYSLVEENDRVRVLRYKLSAGEVTDLHSHPDHVAITSNAAKVRFTAPDGQSMDVDLGAGQTIFVDAGDHRTENIGSTEATGFIVELK